MKKQIVPIVQDPSNATNGATVRRHDPLFLLAALPFFSDPAALSLLIFGVAVVLVTIAFLVYIVVVKK